MEHSKEELTEPVSPLGQCFDSKYLSLYLLVVFEFEVPIHGLQVASLAKDALLSIPRFSSIMVCDGGVKRWKQVHVKLEEHIIEPTFIEGMSMDSYEKAFDEYFSRIAMEKLPQTKPLWQLHVIKYPTTNSAGTLIIKFHHAIGDGYTLMGLLLSSLQRAKDPSLPLSFPSRKSSKETRKIFLRRVPKCVSTAFNTVQEFGWSLMKSTLLEDDRTPIRSGADAVEFRPVVVSHITFSIEHIKEIKSNLGVTLNDVITGIIFYGLRLYMQDVDYRARALKSTALITVNTRNVKDYNKVQDMLKTNAKGAWGNQIACLHVSIPKLGDTPISNPLYFVRKAHNSINKKRHSFATHLTGMLLLMKNTLKGPEAMAKHMYKTIRNSSITISNMIGPLEQMALGNHPIKGFFFTGSGNPTSLKISIMSYMGMLRVTTTTEKGYIDEQKLVGYLNNAFETLRRQAAKENIPS
ncbi:O-acyltransferase WSD1-like [Abrus precatorius]|uniref:O-acyltransferase WSD1-like n=1 Tax=Abrus precatorius TaxID=3816 RepID=A0A8B8LBF4_ABRPR|nr:O-acyltransferase WSD1-like [Abrus precatorius]